MRRRPEVSGGRGGFSLLEMMVATAIMATVMASVVVLVRTSYAVWNAYEDDVDVLENGYGVLRHVVRKLRQADAVTAISTASDTSGDLSILTVGGDTQSWSHNNSTSRAYFDDSTGNQLLAWRIDELSFIGYEADGVTTTETADDIQLVQCIVKVTLSRGAGVSRTLSCRAWVRSW